MVTSVESSGRVSFRGDASALPGGQPRGGKASDAQKTPSGHTERLTAISEGIDGDDDGGGGGDGNGDGTSDATSGAALGATQRLLHEEQGADRADGGHSGDRADGGVPRAAQQRDGDSLPAGGDVDGGHDPGAISTPPLIGAAHQRVQQRLGTHKMELKLVPSSPAVSPPSASPPLPLPGSKDHGLVGAANSPQWDRSIIEQRTSPVSSKSNVRSSELSPPPPNDPAPPHPAQRPASSASPTPARSPWAGGPGEPVPAVDEPALLGGGATGWVTLVKGGCKLVSSRLRLDAASRREHVGQWMRRVAHERQMGDKAKDASAEVALPQSPSPSVMKTSKAADRALAAKSASQAVALEREAGERACDPSSFACTPAGYLPKISVAALSPPRPSPRGPTNLQSRLPCSAHACCPVARFFYASLSARD